MPALAFIVATRQFGSRADDLTTAVLEAGSIVFTTALLTLELRHALYGADRCAASPPRPRFDAMPCCGWRCRRLLLWLGARRQRPVLPWGGIVLFALATVQIVLWQVLVANPLLTGDPVGRTMIFDALRVAYALPAVIYAVIALAAALGPDGPAIRIARILAAGLALFWVTPGNPPRLPRREPDLGPMQRRRVVRLFGRVARLRRRSRWRSAWSGATSGCAARRWSASPRRRQGVPQSDMAELTGVLRALSFIGLGGALIGIGYAYRRLRRCKDNATGVTPKSPRIVAEARGGPRRVR